MHWNLRGLAVAAILVSGLLSGCASTLDASHLDGLTAKITEYGLYNRGQEKIRAEPNSPSGFYRTDSDYKLLEQTDRVPANMGVKFGYCFEVKGFPHDGMVALTEAGTHPEIVRPDGKRFTGYASTIKVKVVNGRATHCGGYAFDHDFELKPGRWTFTYSAGDRQLVSQAFEVY